jgi:hypothetical protein
VRAGPRDPAPGLEGREIEGRRGARRAGATGRGTLLDGFPRAVGLAASGRLEEIDLADAVHVSREAGQLLTESRTAALEQLAIARGQIRVVLIARVLKEADHVRRLHVLDVVHAQQRGVATVTLDLLGQPLELTRSDPESREAGRRSS